MFWFGEWRQGEANDGDPLAYACQQRSLIVDWQSKFSRSPGFHFSFVELAPGPGAQVAKRRTFLTSYLRTSQLESLGMPNVSYATAVDKGDPFSPAGWWHPRYKQPVAARLAAVTLRDVYGQNVMASGPSLLNATSTTATTTSSSNDRRDSSGAAGPGYTLTYDSETAQGLHLAPTMNCSYVGNLLNLTYGAKMSSDAECCSTVSPFEVLSASSSSWSPATATIGSSTSNQVTITAGAVASGDGVDGVDGGAGTSQKLIGVRYAWADFPLCMLYNKQGVVASPFSRAGCEFDSATKFTSWPMLDNTQGNAKPAADAGPIHFLGKVPSAVACAEKASAAAAAATSDDRLSYKYKSYSWFASDYTQTKGDFANACYGRVDSFWHPINGCPNGDPGCGKHNVTSGQVC